MADCSQLLPNDVWRFIGEKLHVTADRIGFRSVCRRWRSVLPFPQPPWLVLAEDEQTPDTRGFFGLGQSDEGKEEQVVYQFELPEVYRTRCLGSTGTWLVTIDLQQRIRLINPFARLQFHLPSQDTLEYGPEKDYQIDPEDLRDGYTWKVILSSPPSSSSPQDCIAMALHQCNRRLAIARPGDPSWTTVQTPLLKFVDAIFYKNKFYAINYNGILVVCDLLGDDQTPPVANTLTDIFKENDETQLYLVEWSGELLLVIKFMHDEDDEEDTYNVDKFQLYIFDFTNKTWNELNSLGDHSVFLGFNTSVSVEATQYPGLKANCIYFTDDYTFGYRGYRIPGGLDMGIFDLEDKTITLHYKGVSTSLYSPPLWIIPKTIHHTT